MTRSQRRIARGFALSLGACLTVSAAEAAHKCEANTGIWNDTQINSEQEADLRAAFTACTEGTGDDTACSDFVAKALDTGWGASDFNINGTYLGQKAIGKWFAETDHGNWEKLGNGASQDVLNTAASRAAAGDAVIAIYNGGGESHVAIVLPGGTAASSSWNMMKVPRAISLPVQNVKSAFFGCRLSWGYSGERGADLTFYAKAGDSPATAAAPTAPAEPEAAERPVDDGARAPETPAEPEAPEAPEQPAEPEDDPELDELEPETPETPDEPEDIE